jgi:PASTA domain
MEAALAASSGYLDRTGLLASSRNPPSRIPPSLVPSFASHPLEPAVPPFAEDLGGPVPATANGRVALPDVSGLPVRVAIRHLHRLGLRVAQVGVGEIVRSTPRAGSLVLPGDTIRLSYRGQTYD